MNEPAQSRLGYLAGTLVLLSASVHLLLGIAGLFNPGVIGVETIVLPVLFIVAALGAYTLVGAFRANKLAPETAYSIGAAMMLIYLVAYVDWHALQLAESVIPLDVFSIESGHSHGSQHDQSHGDGTVLVLIDHLRDDPLALITKTAELAAAAVLVLLVVGTRSKQNT